MLNGVPGGDPLTFSIAVVAAVAASHLVYRDADRHGHYHALSASAAVGIAALVGFVVANLVGLAVATGYVLLLYLLSYPSTPGIDGEEERRTPERPDGSPQGDAGENIASAEADDVVSVIRVEIANEETLRELAARDDDVPADAPVGKLRSMLRVRALDSVLDETETDDEFSLRDWAGTDEASVDDWHGESPSGDAERPAEGAVAWNAAPAGEEDGSDAGTTADETASEERDDIETWTTETLDEDADEVEAGSIAEWTAVGDGGEGTETAENEPTAEGADDSVSVATAENEEGSAEGGFGWAEVEAEE